MKNNYKKAFSLIEISIVIIVVGILIAGISQGIDLYQDARLANVRALTLNSRVGRIPDLVVWLETVSEKSFDKNEAIDNAPISKWLDINPIDKSGNLSYSSLTNRPTYSLDGINNLPALKFDGSNDYLISNPYPNRKEKQLTYFIVAKRISHINYNTSSFGIIANGDSSDSNLSAFVENTGNEFRAYTASGRTDSILNPIPGNNVPYIASSIFTGTSSTLYYVMGKISRSDTDSFSVTTNFDINKIIIGSRWGGGAAVTFYNGYIGGNYNLC